MFLTEYVCKWLVIICEFLIPPAAAAASETKANGNKYTELKKDEETKTKSTWSDQWAKLKKLLTFFWPEATLSIKIRICASIFIVIVENSVNVLVPVYNQKIVDTLDNKIFCWDLILIYVAFQFSSMGPLWSLRSYLWTHVEQFINGNTERKLFEHLHTLSSRWHASRKPSEVLDIMGEARWTVGSLVNYGLFSFGPAILNIFTSVFVLTATFNWCFGLLIALTLALYLRLRIYVTDWAEKYEEQKRVVEKEQSAIGVDSLLNIETIKYCGTTKYEVESFRSTTLEYEKEQLNSDIAYHVSDLFENVVICGSLLIGSLFCAYLVVDVRSLSSGQYVFFAAYILQLFAPMNQLSRIYRDIHKSFIDMEKLFDILNEKPEVVDAPDAVELMTTQAYIEFSNVTFGYIPERTILKDISFSVAPGKTVALVGPSGSGKSTIIRLLSRFYDVDGGSISVDGLNVKKITQESLHAAIGIVPQDTVLFNKTIKYNIKYGRLNATDDEVEFSARAAEIHEDIISFPDKYDTEVGERGLKLSGGEKQRVAIARTILKAPPIVLLDEATSALDTQTERNIQAALANVCKNRTTIIVAHRLSTIIHADEILVMKHGEIIERGAHEALLDTNEPQVTTLTELAAKCVASFIPFELVEHVYPPVPEQLQLRIAYWSFPDNEEDIRLYSCLANSSADEFHRGDQLFKNRLVKESLQIGFHLSATVVHCSPPRTQFNVAVTFDRRRISSCNCTCSSAAYWCSHVVAVCLHRIHCPNEVLLRAPVSESLTRLQRDQLQKFAQYLISELPQQILPTAQRLLDELLSCQPTAINTVCGAPDPTAGASANDQTNWYLDEKTLHDNIKKILIKFCLPAPMVFSDVNYLTNSAPPAAAEWSSLLRPLRGREPEGMWNLLLIVREMYRRCDRNAIRLLEIITEECMVCDQILVWWFNTKLSLLFGTGGHTGGKHSNTHSNANASQHACSSLCDEIVILWRLAALNPGLAPDERDMLHAQFTAWHLKILDRIVKCRVQSSSYSNKHQNNLRTDAELFIGFKPAIEACYLDWEDYQIAGITHTQDTNPMYHCPFTCFKHTDSKCETQSQVNSSQAILSTHKRYNYIISDHHHQLKRSYRAYASSSNNSSNSSSDSVNLGRNPLPNEPDDCNRSSASSEGFCENEDDGVDSTVLEHSQATEDVPSETNNKSSGTETTTTTTTTTKVKSNENDSQGGESSSSSVALDDNKSNRKTSNNVNKTMTSVSTSLTSNFSNSNVVNNSASVNSKNANIFSVSKSNNIVNYVDDAIAGNSSSCSSSSNTSPAVAAPTTKSANEPNPSVSSLSSFNAKYLLPVSTTNTTTTTTPSSMPASLLSATTTTTPAIPSTSNTFVPQPSTSRGGDSAVVDKSTDPKAEPVDEDRRPSKDESVSSTGSQQSDEFNMYYYDSKTNQNKLLEQQAKIDQGTNKAQIFSNIKPTEDAWDILFARAEGLHAHGHGREACYLAVRLAEEMLAHPPNLMIEMPPPMKRKGKKMNVNPISHQLSVLASGTLSKCAFLCIVLAENSEHYHLSFRICLFGLEMPRPPASTKPLEVKLANQEADLLGLLKRIPLGHLELNVIREKAEKLRDGQLRSRGEALLPIMLASFIFDALVMPSVAGKETRMKVMSMSYRIPTDENLGFEAAVAALGLKANVSEAEHPLLCEGTRRQRGDLALTLLYYYKDEPRKIARIMDKLIDREIHTLIKTQLLPSYYSNNPPVRTQAAQARRDEQDLAAHYNNEHFQNEFCTNSRPHSSTSAELEIGMNAMCLSQQNTPTTSNNQGQPVAPTITNTNARSKESRYNKGKRIYPSIPNQPSEASAHFMFELAKNVLTKAGGTSSTSLFTQATTNQNHHGPHRALHMCAFQLGLYALGLHNCVSSNWLSRTYSSHVSWILGQAMEIGAPAISFLIDTWEGHLTPPEAAGMADRASRGWDSNMVYPSAELALSVLPHAAALNPNEITRAILQCKEQSDQMLERACFTVEHAAKGGGVYPEVLFQVAKYWYELYMRNSPHGHDNIHDDNHHVDHNVQLAAIMDVSDMQQQPQPGPNPQVVVTASPPQPYQPGVTTIAPIYGPYGFACQGIYHHHNIAYPHNQMQMYISAPQAFQYPPPTNQPPPFVHQPVGATFQSMNHSAVASSAFTAMQCPTGQQFQVPVQVPPPAPNVQIPANMQFFVPPPALPPNSMRTQPPPQSQAGSLNQPPPNQQIQQQMQPHGVVYGNTFIQPPPAHPPQRQRHIHHFSPQQLRYLLAAYNVGMLAMETLARRVHDDRPQAKYARNPPYGEDVKWLLQISKKLGTQYLHQFCVCAVNSIVSPFVLHDVALESAHFLARNNPTLVMQHLRSALTPLVQKCQQMYIQCIHQKLYHLTAADYEDFASIILAARAAFQITPEGNNQFKDWIQTIRRSKSCKKDLWAQINTALQSNSK